MTQCLTLIAISTSIITAEVRAKVTIIRSNIQFLYGEWR